MGSSIKVNLPPELKTKHFILKPYQAKDENRFIEIVLDKGSVQFMGGSTGNEVEERLVFKKIFEVYKTTKDRWFWIWGIYQNNILCGHLELKETEHTNADELEIVYMIHPQERRKGIMTEVLELIKQHQKIWGKKIIATLSPKNVNSIALLKKWGIEKTEELIDKETNETYLKLSLKN